MMCLNTCSTSKPALMTLLKLTSSMSLIDSEPTSIVCLNSELVQK